MCGIAGIYSKNRPIEVLNKIAKNMANTISHRGPDTQGLGAMKVLGYHIAVYLLLIFQAQETNLCYLIVEDTR